MEECSPKRAAALGALSLVEELGPSIVGVGTGSTVAEFIKAAGEVLRGVDVIASSIDTELRLRGVGIRPISPLSGARPEVYVDGADEVDGEGRMIKGGGGALLGEKILAYNSRVNVFIVDESKLVEVLGSRRPVPVEVVPHALSYVMDSLESMGYRVEARASGGKAGPVVSDWGGVILDIYTGPIPDPSGLDARLKGIPGVVETGIFYGVTDYLVIGMQGCKWRIVRAGRKA